jgi:tetratricopeptide (TPR) repeat protein
MSSIEADYRELMSYAARLVSLGDMAGALSIYREAIVVDPHCATTYHKMGLLLQCAGQSDEARGYLNKALDLDTETDRSYIDSPYRGLLARAGELIALGDLQGAEDAYRQAITLSPRQAEAYYAVAVLHWSQQHPRQAAYAMEKAARFRSTDPLAWNDLGMAYSAAGMYHEAVDAYGEAVVLDPSCIEAWAGLMDTYLALGEAECAALAGEHCGRA